MNPIIHNLTEVFPCALDTGPRRALDEALGAFTEKEALSGILRAVARREDDLTAESLDWYYREELDGDAAVGRWSLMMQTNDYSRAGGAVLSLVLRASENEVKLSLQFRPLGFTEAREKTIVTCQRPAEPLKPKRKSPPASASRGAVFIYAGRPAADTPPSWLQSLALKRSKQVDHLLDYSLQQAVSPTDDESDEMTHEELMQDPDYAENHRKVQRRMQRALREEAKEAKAKAQKA